MTTRTVGVEEEQLLIDTETRAVSDRSTQVLKSHHEHGPGRDPHRASDEIDRELFQHQIEIRTDPEVDLGAIRDQIVDARRTAGESARAEGLAMIVSGTAPLEHGDPRVSPKARYREMVEIFGETARTGRACGTHVHVEIESPEEGVGIIDRISPWLSVLVAVAANSPFTHGRDTRYASWRSQTWTRWPSAGPTPPFGSLDGYREASRLMLMTGAAQDEAMLYYDARLSAGQPTVEVRVLDACTEPEDVVLSAALVRGLVETAAEEWAADRPMTSWRPEILRGAQWRAARYGVTDALVDPVRLELASAREVLDSLVDYIRLRLEAAGDLDLVTDGVQRVLREGGATMQRRAFERTGSVEGVVDDLIQRTENSWGG